VTPIVPAVRESVTRLVKGLQGVLPADGHSPETIPYQFEQRARRDPAHPFLLYRDQRYTYRDANLLANRHAATYRSAGIRKGDVVALVMENRPEFYWHYLGLGKLGAIAALVNAHAVGKPLAHAIRIASPRRIVIGSEVLAAFEAARGELSDLLDGPSPVPVEIDVDPEGDPPRSSFAVFGDRLPDVRLGAPPDPIETSLHTLGDLAAYIYTSGTTGMPKAALVRHHRFYRAGRIWGGFAFRYQPSDVLYISLPLYHGNAMILGTSSVISYGVTIALARKFSTRSFWDDCRRYDATCFLYIGELCRYLHGAPPKANDRDHRVRAISGNGLRPDIWESFQARFGIERIAEFYASTEGNVVTLNMGGRPGSVGRMTLGQAIAKWDDDKQDFVRGRDGHLERCAIGEVGVMLGKIGTLVGFDGYEDPKATERKIVRDAFEDGDAWFNTGDLMRVDWMRNLYFADRLGDTFRWKGENVSTFEVQEQLASWPPIKEVNVYGVAVEGAEGRAGMASLVLNEGATFDPVSFKAHVDAAIPKFARPVFVRIDQAMETTTTLKLKKGDLARDGFDPSKVRGPVFVRHPETGEYVPLDARLYGDIAAKRLRL
jgi:acyl-CoA synthetase (AMP-forming)/AMP-acid ligase II